MLQRFGKKEGISSLVLPFIFYTSIVIIIYLIISPYISDIKNEALVVLGFFAFWRYGWQITNFIRAGIYSYIRYPYLKKIISQQPESSKYPDHIFFVIPSYKEEDWVSIETFQSILSNLSSIPSTATLIVATGSDADDAIISETFMSHPGHYKAELVIQRQNKGKRIAMGHMLRAVARRYTDEVNSVTLFMDGDSYLEVDTLKNTLPFFTTFKDLGAVTTNEIAYINTKNKWYKDWFNLKFGQRHILFQSHSLSNKVLTLTGRFSVFRTSIICSEDFISLMENDIISHWAHGTFRFLMGDDKSSWFYLLKNNWNMLYLPDVLVYSLESRDASFWDLSTSLPFRWYGNTLRNNNRTLKLGWRKTGFFIWLAILDQRLSMWTSLVGLTGAALLSLSKSIVYFPFYIGWVILVRTFQMTIIALRGHPVSMLTIPLMLYNQWVGSLIKIKAFHNLGEQKWSKGTESQKADNNRVPVPHWFSAYLNKYLHVLSYVIFFTGMAFIYDLISLPKVTQLTKKESAKNIILAAHYGVIADDNIDDSFNLNKIIESAPDGSQIVLPSGEISLKSQININRNNITLSGSQNTLLLASFTDQDKAVINIEGERRQREINNFIIKTAHIVTIQSKENLSKDQSILLIQENDVEFLHNLGSQVWNKRYPQLRRQLNTIKEISDNQITLTKPVPAELMNSKAKLYSIETVKNVTIKNLTVEYTISHKSISDYHYIYSNPLPNHAVDLIRLNWTNNIQLEELQLNNAGKHSVSIENSFDCQLSDLNIDGAWNKGKTGFGYLKISKSHYCNLKRLSVRNIRHIAIQWGSSFNTIDNLYTEVDINFHGGYSNNNTVSNVTFNLPTVHRWDNIYRTPKNARWAPPDGPNNIVN
jgi:glycosyltransferase Alg8